MAEMNLEGKKSVFGRKFKAARLLWHVVYLLFIRYSPRPFHRWRFTIYRLFGARLQPGARIYPKAEVWAPWLLSMGRNSTLGDYANCYCVGGVVIGNNTTVSQYAYLCGATHDHMHPRFPLIPQKITIGSSAWVAADVFVAGGVIIGDGVVVGARSSVFNDLPAHKICVGNPARAVKDRIIKEMSEVEPHQ